jgi:hypothetical protein
MHRSNSASRWLRTAVVGLLACAFVEVAVPAPASAQITAEEAKCRATIAKFGGKYIKTVNKVIVGCHKSRSKGKIGSNVDCNALAEGDVKQKAQKAEVKLRAGVAGDKGRCDSGAVEQTNVLVQFGRCPAPAETVDDGGATTGIDDFDELLDCMVEHTRLIAEQRASSIFGLPAVPLAKDLAKCQGAIGKGYAKVVDATVKERNKCQAKLDKSGGPIGFECATAGSGKIGKTADKARAGIAKACDVPSLIPLSRGARAGVADLDSCADDVGGLQACVIDDAALTAGSGIVAMFWELPGICPESGGYQVIPLTTDTELDTGWTGLVHDMDPILGYRGAVFSIACDADCSNCSTGGGGVSSPLGACRCSDDAATVCTTPGVDPACAGQCQCFYGPPTPYVAGGNPVCVTTRLNGAMTGSLDPSTGAISLVVPARVNIFLGYSFASPCPQCVAGVCEGGDRDGLACSTDGEDATFGTVSYGCPPTSGSNVSGTGQTTTVEFTTGGASLPFGTACDPPFPPPPAYACACGACSLDLNVACNSNADCTGIGSCGSHPISFRAPNGCDDLTCSPDVETGEGYCAAGPLDKFCDGFVRSSGLGMIYCNDNADCDAAGPVCPGGDCGACSISKLRDCFLDPIVATGSPGERLVGVGCMGASSNSAVNASLGWPGAYRVRQNIGTGGELLCSDGVTPYVPPGGSNCP